MLHHVSLNVRDPHHVARILAEMIDATAVRAPSPPFPAGSWFVCYGDAAGSFIEFLPWGKVLDPDAPFGVGDDGEMRARSGAHVLVSTPRDSETIQAIAAREGWRFQFVDARLFQVVKVWVENATLVELLPADLASAYRATFDGEGLQRLDAKLRELEAAFRL
jgi:hypothetical protein